MDTGIVGRKQWVFTWMDLYAFASWMGDGYFTPSYVAPLDEWTLEPCLTPTLLEIRETTRADVEYGGPCYA